MKITLLAFILSAFAGSLASPAQAMPAQVLLLRHAEKPAEGDHLSPQGWERAKALPKLFRTRPEFQRFGLPVALYAMTPSKNDAAKTQGSSVRAIETLKFVAADLGQTLHTDYQRDDYEPMVREILNRREYDGKLVVICWEHKVLSDIAAAFGLDPAPEYPGKKFDRAWLLTLHADGAPSFEDLPERLLSDDDDR